MNPDTTHNPDRLPPRELPKRRSGRHRDPLSFDSWVGTPTLVLAMPGATGPSDVGERLAGLISPYRPEVTIHVGYTRGEQRSLGRTLSGLVGAKGALDAVVVPLTAGPHQPTQNAIGAAVAASGARTHVTEGLGPHPMLAEVLHLRLAEAGFVRADRMRLISVVATSSQMADGVVVGSVGGAEALDAAGVSAVLLAARLGITVLPAALDDPASVAQAFARLRDAGAQRPVLAPCLLGPELDGEAIARTAAASGVRQCAELGSHNTLAKIVALRYAEVLNSLEAGGPRTAEELPAPTGSRHRPES